MKDSRRLDVVLHSATGLKKVSASKMAVFAVAWIEPSVRVPSPSNVKAYGTNPVWNTTISLSLEERTMAQGMYLNIELLGHGLVSTRRIGFVSVNMTDIFQKGSKGAAVHSHFQAHPVTRKSGRQQGLLTFDVHLHECPNLLAVQEMIPKNGASIPRSITVVPPASSSPQGPFDFQVQQSDEIVSPGSSTSSEDGDNDHPKEPVRTHTRVYSLRPKSFSSLLSCH
ncbi:hypothetical protein M758_7G022900 [Ceratodon purpureus]|nr:hypothetical protein M758_7G022900 [Ceratodon purpureus]